MKKILITLLLIGNSLATIAKPRLSDYKFIKHSQFGEDGIIQKIFEIIGTKSKFCIEFGGYDGITMSNTAYLWKEKG